MKIMVSACLAGENCKYNGGNNRSEKVLKLMAENEVLTVCPEQMGGRRPERGCAVPRRRRKMSGDCQKRAAGSDRAAIEESQLRSEAAVRRHIFGKAGGQSRCDRAAPNG